MAITVSGQWMADGVPIDGETGLSLVLTSAELGADITYVETATNEAGSAVETSNSLGPVVEGSEGATPYVGIAVNTTWGNAMQDGLDNTWRKFALQIFTACSDMDDIKVAMSLMAKGPDGILTPGGSAQAAWTVGVEYPITQGTLNGQTAPRATTGHIVTPITFGGNSKSPNTSKSDIAISDLVPLPVTIPKGAAFRIWYVEEYTGANMGGPYVIKESNADVDGALGDYITISNSGTAVTTAMIAAGQVPNLAKQDAAGPHRKPVSCISVMCTTVNPTIAVAGDSIWMASTKLGPQDLFDRKSGLSSVPLDVACINLSISAQSVNDTLKWRSLTGMWRMLPYCSTFINALGWNDGANVGNSGFNAEMEIIAGLATAAEKKYVCTITPGVGWSDSHNGWTIPANQTPSGAWTARDAYNQNVRGPRTGLPSYTGYLDLALAACDDGAGRSGRWKASPAARTVAGQAWSNTSSVLTAVGANITSADLYYGWSGANGTALVTSAYISSVTSVDTAGIPNTPSGSGTGKLNFGSYVTDGTHPVKPFWDMAIPIIGMDDAATWARAA